MINESIKGLYYRILLYGFKYKIKDIVNGIVRFEVLSPSAVKWKLSYFILKPIKKEINNVS